MVTVTVCAWLQFNLWLGFVIAQNDRAGENINFKYANLCPDRDSSDSNSYSDSDGKSYNGWLWFHLWLGFVMAQNHRAFKYINFK